ncbi:hypothetical protein MFIFM68171_02398 [Madurella fahalii]|uniref:Uncharacterized protein n=1 Tax=Madurella fahalii TaxID=1157608 RepID=A0ABQ0G349_9PEZI
MSPNNQIGSSSQPPKGPRNKDEMLKSDGPDVNKQPTYTTVGSIYNPKAVTPLQPPARRPRTNRYPQPLRLSTGEPFLPLPDALLTSLSPKAKAPVSPPSTAATLRQYSPLQQNYDRAVSPLSEQEKSATAAGMSMPNTRSGNLPPPARLEDDDSAAFEDTLASLHITVKGLTNLASYPNPMQKAAQKTLARARTGNLSLGRPDTPFSLPSITPDPYKNRQANHTYGATAAAAGLPKPLTAGPPGQRQFKSSTYEATSKVLRQESQDTRMRRTSKFFPPGQSTDFSYKPGLSFQTELDYSHLTGGATKVAHSTPEEKDYGPISPPSSSLWPSSPLLSPVPAAVAAEGGGRTKRTVYDTLPLERIKQYFPDGLPSNYDGRYTPIPENWHEKYPLRDLGYQRECPSNVTSDASRQFYAGPEGLARNTEHISGDHDYRCTGNKFGVIGGERFRPRGGSTERAWASMNKISCKR